MHGEHDRADCPEAEYPRYRFTPKDVLAEYAPQQQKKDEIDQVEGSERLQACKKKRATAMNKEEGKYRRGCANKNGCRADVAAIAIQPEIAACAEDQTSDQGRKKSEYFIPGPAIKKKIRSAQGGGTIAGRCMLQRR
ncbi:MAG TPA: hypothetical protein VMU62_01785, partial [Acidobacteriaceae bacterium]|nr:hypothetical protein [Acidobacteriaceae bacterium]